MDDLSFKTTESIEHYIKQILSLCIADISQIEEHFEALLAITVEKGDNFSNIPVITFLPQKIK